MSVIRGLILDEIDLTPAVKDEEQPASKRLELAAISDTASLRFAGALQDPDLDENDPQSS